jgi:hypothetical protein
MEPSLPTAIGPTSPRPIFSVLRGNRQILLYDSPQFKALGEVQTLSVICTDLPPGSTLTKATTVSQPLRRVPTLRD